MSLIRLISLLCAIGIVVVLIWSVIAGQRAGPGQGEVGVILHGAFLMIASILAAFFALVVVMIALWHLRRLRIVLLCIIGGIVTITALWIGFALLQSAKDDRDYERRRAAQEKLNTEREAAITPIALDYYARLTSGTLDTDQIKVLRPAFEEKVKALGFKDSDRANATTYFQSAHVIYMRLFLNGDDRLGEELGILNASACVHMETDFSVVFTDAQAAEFAQMCPDWIMDYARD